MKKFGWVCKLTLLSKQIWVLTKTYSPKLFSDGHDKFEPGFDENQQAPLKDPLRVPVGPIIRIRSKKIKEALNGLIQEIWDNSKTRHSKLGPKEDEGVVNLIQVIDRVDLT